jgi:hypothetical protein
MTNQALLFISTILLSNPKIPPFRLYPLEKWELTVFVFQLPTCHKKEGLYILVTRIASLC